MTAGVSKRIIVCLTASLVLALIHTAVGYSPAWALRCLRGLGLGAEEARKACTDCLWFSQLQGDPLWAAPFGPFFSLNLQAPSADWLSKLHKSSFVLVNKKSCVRPL